MSLEPLVACCASSGPSSFSCTLPLILCLLLLFTRVWADDELAAANHTSCQAMVAGAFFFSLMALIVKLLNKFGTYELVFWRSVFMFAGSMSILGAKRINPLGPPGSRVLLSMRAAGGFGLTSGYYYAVHHLPLGDAVAITYTNPVITAVAAALLLGEA